MPDTNPGTPHWLWWAFFLALGSVLCNVAFFVTPPAQGVIPWLSLLLALAAFAALAGGLWSLFSVVRAPRTRILGSVLGLITLALSGVGLVSFFHSREVPSSLAAPRLGQKAPDFTLPDSNGQPVSLAQLYSPAPGAAAGSKATAVLLIFYRGYW